jgi:hypothetical protein
MMNFTPIVDQMKSRYSLHIRRWRKQMSGCAWRVYYKNGTIVNCIESPYPKTPISLAIFLHEVGHHAIGFNRYKYRCEEEYYVWLWALDQMQALGVEPDARVKRRFNRSMQYAVGKALRRGVKHLPDSLHQFVPQAA